MAIAIVPFKQSLISEAAELLAKRHSSDRQSLTLMPPRFGDRVVAQKAIEALLKRENTCGAAAMDGDRLVAYLIGSAVLNNDVWGRSGWIRMPGCAYSRDCGAEIIGELYAEISRGWVREGALFHLAFVPVVNQDLVHTWFSLSFGVEQVYALIDLFGTDTNPEENIPGIHIREAGPADRDQLAAMSGVIWKTQVEAPVWACTMPESVDEMAQDWGDLVEDKEVTLWVATRAEKIVALQAYWPAEVSDENMHVPADCINLTVAGTLSDERGKGINTVLTKHGLAYARKNGFRYCDTDWRSANLLSSRFWPKQGFRPAVYRLIRRIDQRILWAHGR